MSEEMIYSIIDDIAHDAKVIISEHLHPESEGASGVLSFSPKTFKSVGESLMESFKGIDDVLIDYFKKHGADIALGDGNEAGGKADCFNIGDEVYFISGGCAVKDKIEDVRLYTSGCKWLRIEEVFRSMDELVEYLKENVHG